MDDAIYLITLKSDFWIKFNFYKIIEEVRWNSIN